MKNFVEFIAIHPKAGDLGHGRGVGVVAVTEAAIFMRPESIISGEEERVRVPNQEPIIATRLVTDDHDSKVLVRGSVSEVLEKIRASGWVCA